MNRFWRGFLPVALVSLCSLFAAVAADEGETPHVGEWLVLGTVPFEEGTDPFAVPASPAVLAAAPDELDTLEGMRWQLLAADANGQANLISRGFVDEEVVFAYLHAYVHSPDERTVTLSVGSDDGIQVFVNGFEVHANWALRGWKPDQDTFPARLGTGWNRLLLRVANQSGGFGGSARILDAGGDGPAAGLRTQAARPSDLGAVRTAAFLRVEKVVSDERLEAVGDDLAFVMRARVRNLGTEPAASASLRVEGGGGSPVREGFSVDAGGVRDVVLRLDPARVARTTATGGGYRVALEWEGAPPPAGTPVELDPLQVLRIVTGEPPLHADLDPAEVPGMLESWRWGERFRADLFEGGPQRFGGLLEAYLDADAKLFRSRAKEVRRAIRDGAREIKKQRITFIGNSHIDMAWLWDRAETIEVVDMTFDQALKFMDEFPFFRYAQSQMQTYDWVDRRFPEMMDRLDAAVRRGKWLPVGGMWVEPDCNLPSGESFVRQILYGKGYIRDRYGIDIRLGWNPDSFGYTWTLPMIFKGAGIDTFITQKIGWNDTTEFPHRLFWWQAPDGSRVLSYFPFTYVDDAQPEVLAERLAHQQEQQPGLTDLLNLYGVGDHGGGPTREMIGRYQEMAETDTFPTVEHEHPREFVERMGEKHAGSIPVWDDELYLEYHRGTYTTQGEMKLRNRRMEAALETAEKFAALAAALAPGHEYPDIELDGAWKRTLFNQFHDILPGSSIPEVYVDARADYDTAEMLVGTARDDALASLASQVRTDGREGVPVVVFNPLSWSRTAEVSVPLERLGLGAAAPAVVDPAGVAVPAQVEGDALLFQARDVPGIGYRTFWVGAADGPGPAGDLEVQGGGDGPIIVRNDPLWAEIDPASGGLRSLLHLSTGREMLRREEGGNVLQLLGDEPSQWDAWNIGYTGEEWGVEGPVEISVLERGPVRARIRAVRRIGGSVLTQDYLLRSGSEVLEVRTHARWDESRKFLKAAFHLTADADEATFEIPYGTIQRPTRPSTEAERARWEVPGQRWADLTDRSGGWGLTLLNDSKYGHDLEGSRLRLSLLRAPKWPDPKADIGEHHFRYGLYPHAGGWRKAGSYRRGAEFNVPLVAWVVEAPSAGPLPPQSALVETDAGHVVLSAFKAARDPESRPRFVLRIHEAEGVEAEVTLRFPFPVSSAWSANLMEDRGNSLPVEGNTVRLPIGPHQLKTVLVEPQS